MAPSTGSFNWPTPRRGPETTYLSKAPSNPVLRGYFLVVLTTIIKYSTWIQKIVWKLNGFEELKEIGLLAAYEARCDPTVIPAASRDKEVIEKVELPSLPCRLNDTTYYTAGDYHKAFLSGSLTPIGVIRTLLPLIDPKTKSESEYTVAFLEVQTGQIESAARASTKRYQDGTPLSPLDGVPVAVKDEIDLAGYSRSLGSNIDFTNPVNQTGWCVKKWEEAGAIIIGKTNMHEIGMDTTGNNPSKKTPLNPHNQSYYCGGSSSGSAMAVAAGICPIAHGADGGGSIRLPASFCGVYGLKPSHGRLSGRPTREICTSVGVHGPMAADLDSLILAYRIMAQPDPENRTSRSFPPPMTGRVLNTTSSTRIKIGIYRDWINQSDPEVLELFNQAMTYYAKNPKYETIEITLPHLQENQKAHALTILNEARSGLTASQIAQLSYPNQLVLSVAGTHASTQDYLAAQKLRNMIMEHLSWLWDKYPEMLIMTPTTPIAGWKIKHPTDITSGYGVSDGDMTFRSMQYVFLANWTGCPALTRPMGYAEGDVPVGLMAMGVWGSEEKLFQWARDGEGVLEGGIQRPKKLGNWVDVLERAGGM